ncbi:MAG: CMP-N,N'-diacetyllegionaminic acid synthase [Elusimicrobia bacterium ADurb.Bin231]|nr:MAG: CMP-N,N'-diacetyllegionaminic acid synthase [Elusimicrobia bacterium ADurb.Bin231]
MNKKNNKAVFLGVIPSRGGSKGIRKKGIKKVCGKPLIAYTIEHALSYKDIYKIIVTTDSSEIAKTAERYGAEVPFLRPKNLAKDNTPMLPVLKHALLNCEKLYSVKIKAILLFDPTSPVRRQSDIKKMIEVFTKKNPDLLIAVSRCRRNPYFHLLKTNKNGFAEHVLKSKFIRRQDAPVVYDITNSCWIFSRRAILNCWRIPRKTLIHEITSFYIDIDNKEDLDYFEYYIKSHNLK